MRANVGQRCLTTLLPIILLLAAVVVTPPAGAQNISGAIYTSKGDGTSVNTNLYQNKCDVFLNGGPPPQAGCDGDKGLPDGCYVYQVTAPPGGGPEELLSQDSITKRFIRVDGGVFVEDDGTCAAAAATLLDCQTPAATPETCTPTGDVVNPSGIGDPGHDAGIGKCQLSGDIADNISARLMPFANTPNNGGVYKVYLTKVEDYSNTCEGVFGFIHDNSKTDNFRVKAETPPPCDPTTEECPVPQGAIDVFKFCDANANGILDPAELLLGLVNWSISSNPAGCSGTTDANGLVACPNLDPDTYAISETPKTGFGHTATCVDGSCGTGACSVATSTSCTTDTDCPSGETCIVPPPGTDSASITVAAGETHNVDFGNVGLSTISGRKFDDRNANGVDNGEAGIAGVKVLLTGTAANGSAVSLCDITDSTGAYSFENLLPGTYTVSEVQPAGTIASTPISCTGIEIALDEATCAGTTETCSFGNVCLTGTGGLTLGFWSNNNGQALEFADDFAMLTALNLRNANGTNRDFTGSVSQNRTALRNWLLAATATNMAYMLSAQLAAMELNVFNNKISGGELVFAGPLPAACTAVRTANPLALPNLPTPLGFISINDLMADANAMLFYFPNTTATSNARTCEEYLKNALDRGNNNLNIVGACPTVTGQSCE